MTVSTIIKGSRATITGSNASILLVEDSPDDIILTRRAFKKNGINDPLVVVRDGAAALDRLFPPHPGSGSTHGLPRLILLDLNLPRLDGLAVLRRIKADPRTRHIPIVVLSSSTEASDLETSYRYGANSYIQKPIGLNEFVDMIRVLYTYWLELNRTPPNRPQHEPFSEARGGRS